MFSLHPCIFSLRFRAEFFWGLFRKLNRNIFSSTELEEDSETVHLLWIEPSDGAVCKSGQNTDDFASENVTFLEESFWLPISISDSLSNVTLLRYLYVAENGVVVLTESPLSLSVAAALRNPSHMLNFWFLNEFKIVIAPLWMRSALYGSESSVCIESINILGNSENETNLMKSVDDAIKSKFSLNFTSQMMTVATWRNIVPRWISPHERQNITGEGLSFQLIIATDFVSAYIVTSYGEMTLKSRNSKAEYTHALGPAVFRGKIQKIDNVENKENL